MAEVPPQFKQHTFRPGQSGNPGGRAKNKGRELARYILDETKDGKELVDLCLEIARDKRIKRTVRLRAIAELFDRGLGKAPQTVEVSATDGQPAEIDFSSVSLEERRRLLDALAILDLIADREGANGEPTSEH